jgi:hypothetical protein
MGRAQMFKQEDLGFPREVQKYGCYFFCLLRICELESGLEFTAEQVRYIYVTCLANGSIGANCSCQNPDKICSTAMPFLRCKKKVMQVGSIDKTGKPMFWGWANRRPYNDPQYVALTYKTGGKIGTHYVLANAMQEIIYDPSITDYTTNQLLGGLLHKVVD